MKLDLLLTAYCLNVLMFVGLIIGYVIISNTYIKKLEGDDGDISITDTSLIIYTKAIFIPLIILKLLVLVSIGSCMYISCGKGWYILWGVIFCLGSFICSLSNILGDNVGVLEKRQDELEESINDSHRLMENLQNTVNNTPPNNQNELLLQTIENSRLSIEKLETQAEIFKNMVLIVKILNYVELVLSGLMFAAIIFSNKYTRKGPQVKHVYVHKMPSKKSSRK